MTHSHITYLLFQKMLTLFIEVKTGMHQRDHFYSLCHVFSHLVVDGGSKLNENEAESHHRQNTEEGGQEYGEPNVRLVQRVSCGAWKHILKGFIIIQPYSNVYGL